MFRLLFALIIIIPAIEIAVLIWVGSYIGAGWTFALIVMTGILGAWFAKRQGAQVLRLAQIQIQNRDMPSDAIFDGICVLAGGIFLLAPGFITDLLGLILLVPATRSMIKGFLSHWIGRHIRRGSIGFFTRRPF